MKYGDLVKVVTGKHKGLQGIIEFDMPGWGKSGQFGIRVGCGSDIITVDAQDVELVFPYRPQILEIGDVVQILQEGEHYGEVGEVTSVQRETVKLETGKHKTEKLSFPPSSLRLLGK